MQQYLTLDEAAKRLAMSPDELREMAKKKTIRAFQDRGSWRFRSQDIDELARARGLVSDPELPLGEAGRSPAPTKRKTDSDRRQPPADVHLEDDDEVPLGREKFGDKGPRSKAGKSAPKPGSDSDVRLVLDNDMNFPIDLDSEVRVEPSGPKGPRKSKLDADSGVRLGRTESPSDSDVRLDVAGKEGSGKKVKSSSDSDIRLQDQFPPSGNKGAPGPITEEIDLDAESQVAQKKPPQKGGKPKATMMANPAQLPTSSPFELSEPDLSLDDPKKGGKAPARPRSEVDSSSDFELVPFDHTKSPVDLGSGEIPLLTGDEEINFASDIAGAGNSGINLQDPRDSGISLESGGSDEIDFELSLDAGTTPQPTSSRSGGPRSGGPKSGGPRSGGPRSGGPKSGGPKSAPKKPAPLEDDSSSEFELSLDDSDSDTDSSSSEFELSLDEGDSSVQESSDSEFELTLDEDGGLQAEEEAQDIFEETNFDVPALEESGSEAVALDDGTDSEGSSDFEISLDGDEADSGSQVVALDDDEEADAGAATIAKPRKGKGGKAAVVEEDDDFDVEDSAPAAKKGGKKKPPVEVDEDEDEDEDEDGPVAVAAPANWGALPAVFLFPTVAVLFVVGIMGFEVLRGMWGYQQASPVGKPLIDAIARQFDDSLPK